MCRLEQLFIENKFDPEDDQLKPLTELLAVPLDKEVKKQKRKQGINQLSIYTVYHITTYHQL